MKNNGKNNGQNNGQNNGKNNGQNNGKNNGKNNNRKGTFKFDGLWVSLGNFLKINMVLKKFNKIVEIVEHESGASPGI